MEIHSEQAAPYISLMGQTLGNHSYVNLTQVGNDDSGSDSVQCHTDLNTCCETGGGPHRGDWHAPGATSRLPFPGDSGDIYEAREAQRVDLRRTNNANSPVGIYRCDIPTNAVHHSTDNSLRATVYVGLYTGDGGMLETC